MTPAERPILHRWTRREYERSIDHGFLDEDDPIELLDGLLLVKEPQHSPHRTAVLLVAKAVERGFVRLAQGAAPADRGRDEPRAVSGERARSSQRQSGRRGRTDDPGAG
jgi:hypothetical protein